jgi:hypothetical protein
MVAQTQSQFTASLKKYYSFYTGGFVAFVIALAILEQLGVPNKWLGYMFLFATIGLYAGIGIMSRTTWPGGACRPSSTAWPPAPTGCPPPRSSAWPGPSTRPATTA